MPSSSQIDITDQLGRMRTPIALIAFGLLAALASITVSVVFLFLLLPLIVVSIAMLIRGAVLWYIHRNPPQPQKPRAKKAKRDSCRGHQRSKFHCLPPTA